MDYLINKIETRPNTGDTKLGDRAVCAQCGQSLKGAKSYTVHIWKTPCMAYSAYYYYHLTHAPTGA